MAKLYKNFVTRQLRFFNRSSMLTAMDNNYIEVNIEGCYVSNTSSYVDISLPSNNTPNKLFEYSSVLFDQNYTSYIAFIDRIEPNNFNNVEDDNLYYRLYISIDWWSTILYQDNGDDMIADICSNLDGEVVRAHVDDVQVRLDGEKFVTMDYTLLEPEFDVERYVSTKKRLVDDSQGYARKFVYIFSTTKPFEGIVANYLYQNVASPTVKIGNKTLKCGQFCCVGVVSDNENDTSIDLLYKFKRNGAIVSSFTKKLNLLPSVDCFDDSDIISISCSDFNPFLTDDYHTFEMTPEGGFEMTDDVDYTFNEGNVNLINFSTIYNNMLFDNGNLVDCGGIIMRDIEAKSASATRFNVATRGNVYEFAGNGYESYLRLIQKQYFAPYSITCAEKGDERVVIDTAHIETDSLFSYVYVPWLGNYIIYSPTMLNDSESSYTTFANNCNFERVSTNDEFTSRQAMVRSLGVVGSALGLAPSVGGRKSRNKGVNVGGIAGSIVGVVGSAIETENINEKILRQGENGTKLVQGSSSDFVHPLVVSVVQPEDTSKEALREDLALYGYNTYLHPYEILTKKTYNNSYRATDHRRRYFNYMRTNNANLKTSSYSSMIKSHIEEMFNRGVWLWNTAEEFGNFKVANFPNIIWSVN